MVFDKRMGVFAITSFALVSAQAMAQTMPDKEQTATIEKPAKSAPSKATVAAQAKPKPAPKSEPVDALRPGQYGWMPEKSLTGPLKIVAVLSIQRMYVFRNNVLIGFSTISSGKPGHETPFGVFTILEKDIDHHSNKYSNAPMPYMQRLTWDGVAMHAGHLPGVPASHGCIRLPLAFSKLIYSITNTGQTVVVLKNLDDPTPPPAGAKPPETPPVAPPPVTGTPPVTLPAPDPAAPAPIITPPVAAPTPVVVDPVKPPQK